MKRFLLKFAVFSLVCLTGCVGMDLLFSRRYQQSAQPLYAAWYDLMHGRVQAKVIVNGNSRAWALLSPAILDSVLNTTSYNLGIDGSAFNRQSVKYRLFRHYNPKPSLIIQNIDHMSMEFTDGYQRSQFYPYLWNPVFRKAVTSVESIPFPDKYLPFFRYRGMPLPEDDPHTTPILYKGYHAQDLHWNGKALRNLDSFRFVVDPRTETLFDEFLQETAKEGIRVVFVFAPFYEEGFRKIENRQEMRAFYEKYARRYNIPILDYTTLDICRDTACFYNATHMNRRGAELYSRTLAKDLLSLATTEDLGR